MECWNCKYFSYVDYEIVGNGNENPFGTCENKKSEDFETKVYDGYTCNEYKSK